MVNVDIKNGIHIGWVATSCGGMYGTVVDFGYMEVGLEDMLCPCASGCVSVKWVCPVSGIH